MVLRAKILTSLRLGRMEGSGQQRGAFSCTGANADAATWTFSPCAAPLPTLQIVGASEMAINNSTRKGTMRHKAPTVHHPFTESSAAWRPHRCSRSLKWMLKVTLQGSAASGR